MNLASTAWQRDSDPSVRTPELSGKHSLFVWLHAASARSRMIADPRLLPPRPPTRASHRHLGREFCAWTDDYPSADTIHFDLARNSLFCLKTKTGHDLAGVISFDADPETDILDCWSKELVPSVEFARVAVSLNYQGCGICRKTLLPALLGKPKGAVSGARPLSRRQDEQKRRSARTGKLQFSYGR